MQWFEMGLAALVIVGAASVFLLDPGKWMRWAYLFATGFVLWIDLRYGTPRWQLLPLYVATALLLAIQFAALGTSEGGRPVKLGAWTAFLLCLVSLAFCWTLPVFKLPPPTGPYPVATSSEMFYDKTRGEDGVSTPGFAHWRQLPVRMWFPYSSDLCGQGVARYTDLNEVKPLFRYKAQIRTNSVGSSLHCSTATLPLLLFGPMWNGSRVQDTFLAEELASHGYLVVAIDHPGNAALALTDAGVVKSDRAGAVSVGPATSAAGLQATWARELKIWVADDEAVLNELIRRDRGYEANPTGGNHASVDVDRIGAFGALRHLRERRVVALERIVTAGMKLRARVFRSQPREHVE